MNFLNEKKYRAEIVKVILVVSPIKMEISFEMMKNSKSYFNYQLLIRGWTSCFQKIVVYGKKLISIELKKADTIAD